MIRAWSVFNWLSATRKWFKSIKLSISVGSLSWCQSKLFLMFLHDGSVLLTCNVETVLLFLQTPLTDMQPKNVTKPQPLSTDVCKTFTDCLSVSHNISPLVLSDWLLATKWIIMQFNIGSLLTQHSFILSVICLNDSSVNVKRLNKQTKAFLWKWSGQVQGLD